MARKRQGGWHLVSRPNIVEESKAVPRQQSSDFEEAFAGEGIDEGSPDIDIKAWGNSLRDLTDEAREPTPLSPDPSNAYSDENRAEDQDLHLQADGLPDHRTERHPGVPDPLISKVYTDVGKIDEDMDKRSPFQKVF